MNPMDILSILLSLGSSAHQDQQAREANAANEADQQEALGIARGNAGDLTTRLNNLIQSITSQSGANTNALLFGGNRPATGTLEDVTRTLMAGGTKAEAEAAFQGEGGDLPEALQGFAGRFGDAMSRFTSGRDSLKKGYRDRIGTTLGMLNTFGNSAREGQDRIYDREDGLAVQDAIDSGLFSSTVLPTMRAGVNERRAASSRALEEQISTQKANAFRDLSSEALGAEADLLNKELGWLTGLSGDFLGASERGSSRDLDLASTLGMAGLNLSRDNANREIDLVTGYPASGPPRSNPFDAVLGGLNTISARNASQPQTDSNDWWGPALFNSGSNLAGLGIFGSFLR